MASRKATKLVVIPGKAKSKLEEDQVDALFRVPPGEFTGARNTLATRLKKEGLAAEAGRIKALAKPSISAWTVNQLFWNHRDSFDRLLETGQRIRAGKATDMRAAVEARRETLSELSDLATVLLRDAGHNPALDTLRRITTTLEAMTAYVSLPEGLTPGRLTADIDPPGFDSFASFAPGPASPRTEKAAPVSPKKSIGPPVKTAPKSKPGVEIDRLKEKRQAQLAAAKMSVQEAKKALVAARTKAQNLVSTQKKADNEAKQADKHRREAETRFKAASAEAEAATRRARSISVEVEAAQKAIDAAQRTVEKASQELESLFRAK